VFLHSQDLGIEIEKAPSGEHIPGPVDHSETGALAQIDEVALDQRGRGLTAELTGRIDTILKILRVKDKR
jgi:hypothetical protein